MSDPASFPTWAIPVAREVINNRGLIKSTFQSAINFALGRRSAVVFTGAPGVGKTVLLEHLTGAARATGYRPPLASTAVERGKVREISELRVGISVVPGQDSAPRAAAIDTLFLGKHPVDGFVHVVDYGFTELRSAAARETLRTARELDTLEAYRAYQMERELEDLRDTLHVVRRAVAKHRKPTWMVVASTKADLYTAELAAAEMRYSPEGEGPFAETIRDFVGRVGSDNFRWDAAPVSAWLDAFEWGSERRASSLNAAERDQMLLDFARTLANHCGGIDGR